jgi:hypothetical protein
VVHLLFLGVVVVVVVPEQVLVLFALAHASIVALFGVAGRVLPRGLPPPPAAPLRKTALPPLRPGGGVRTGFGPSSRGRFFLPLDGIGPLLRPRGTGFGVCGVVGADRVVLRG